MNLSRSLCARHVHESAKEWSVRFPCRMGMHASWLHFYRHDSVSLHFLGVWRQDPKLVEVCHQQQGHLEPLSVLTQRAAFPHLFTTFQ